MSSSSVDEDEWDDFASFPTNAQETPVHVYNNSSEATISDEDWNEFDLSSPLSNGHTINNRSIEHIDPSHRDSVIETSQFNLQPLDSSEMNEVGHSDASQRVRDVNTAIDLPQRHLNSADNIDLSPQSTFSTDTRMATEPNHEVQTIITHRASLIDSEHNNNGQTLQLSNSIAQLNDFQDTTHAHPVITNPNQTSNHIPTTEHSESPAPPASPVVEDNTQTNNTLPISSHTQYSTQPGYTASFVIEGGDTPDQGRGDTHIPIIVQESELRPPEPSNTEHNSTELDNIDLADAAHSIDEVSSDANTESASAVVIEATDEVESHKASSEGGQATDALFDTTGASADASTSLITPHSSPAEQAGSKVKKEEVQQSYIDEHIEEHTEEDVPVSFATIDTFPLDQSQDHEVVSSRPFDTTPFQNGGEHPTFTTLPNSGNTAEGNTEGGDDDWQGFETSNTVLVDSNPTPATAPPPVSSPVVQAKADEAGIVEVGRSEGEGEVYDNRNDTNIQGQVYDTVAPVDTYTPYNDTAQIDDEEEEDDWQAFESSPPPLPDMSAPILTKDFNDSHISHITQTDIEQQSFEISSSSQLQLSDTHVITNNNTGTAEVDEEEEEDEDDWQAFESNTLSEPAPTPASVPTPVTVLTPAPVPVYSTPSYESAPPTTPKQPTLNKASLTCNILEANVSIYINTYLYTCV